jgi:hypothetical protein
VTLCWPHWKLLVTLLNMLMVSPVYLAMKEQRAVGGMPFQ